MYMYMFTLILVEIEEKKVNNRSTAEPKATLYDSRRPPHYLGVELVGCVEG